jgi:hypothetical protein
MTKPQPKTPQKIVRARIPHAMNDALCDVTATTGETTSALIKAALIVELTKRGLWPPRHTQEQK